MSNEIEWKFIIGCIPCNFECHCCDTIFYRCSMGVDGYKRKINGIDTFICKSCINCVNWGECLKNKKEHKF